MAVEGRNLIGGRWLPAASGRRFESRSPADREELLGVFPDSGEEEVEAAVAAVAAAQPAWAAKAPEQRAEVLERAAALMLARKAALAEELTREEGKTLAEAGNEIGRTAANLKLYAGEALGLRGETYPVGPGQLVCSLRRPLGVVAAITPWNFPTSIPARKLGPALALGNGVVFKPSELTPLLGQRLAELLLEAGLPEGVLALVQGRGATAGRALVRHPQVAAVTFTGSWAVGEQIHHEAGPLKRSQLEMGGKNPCVVLEDADPETALQVVLRGAFGLSGQACTGTSRVIAVGAAYDALRAALPEAAAKLQVGNGLEAGVQMGPLASETQCDKVLGHVEAAKAAGIAHLGGGLRLTEGDLARGCYVTPAVFAEMPQDSALAREEIFGPVVGLQRAADAEEALALANDSDYGLAAALVTRDLARALDFAERIEAGVIKINSPTTGVALTAPFGGLKRSSNQLFKEQAGAGVMDFYCSTRTLYLAG